MPLMSPCLEQTFQGHHRPDPGCEHGSNSTACSRQRASGQPSRCVGSSTAEGPAACCVPWASPYPPLGRTNAQGPLQLGQSEARDLLQASGSLWSQGHATGRLFHSSQAARTARRPLSHTAIFIVCIALVSPRLRKHVCKIRFLCEAGRLQG